MNILPINFNQTSFQGYVDMTFKNAINRTVMNEIKYMKTKANNNGIQLKESSIKDVIAAGEYVINRLTEFLKPLHPKTNIAEDYSFSNLKIYLTNDSLNSNVNFNENNTYLKNKIYKNSIYLECLPESINNGRVRISSFVKFADDLVKKINAKDIDKALFKSFLESKDIQANKMKPSLFNNFRLNRIIKKSNQFAKEIGLEDSYDAHFKEIYENNIEKDKTIEDNNKLADRYIKKLEKEN